MFKVVAERRKRSVWSPRTVTASVAVHLLLLAGFVSAAENHEPERRISIVEIGPVPPEPPRVVRTTPPPPPPAEQPKDQPAPVKGTTLQLPAPDKVPDRLPPPDLTAIPTHASDYNGDGPVGDVIGTPTRGEATQPTGGEGILPDFEKPVPVESADVKPELSNRRQAEQLLQRNYPPFLRDAGVVGHTTVQLIIDANGNVEPGSVIVQDATNDAFRDAAVRAVERFRFTPARYRGRTVSVLVTLPIEWTLQN